ncbi:DUF1080 domain-containing protein [candidate division KSB1 bacterium]|nr:DUF1080 domain-containing protein [candidate division KSB1 bacterium]
MNKLFIFIVLASGLMLSCSQSSKWIPLFNGTDLDGWTASENSGTFSVQDGQIVCNGARSHLFYSGEVNNAEFKNFELKVDVKAEPGANSGVFFHTEFQDEGWPAKGYEVQVNNSQVGNADYRELKKTASLYGVRNIYKQLVNDNEWFTLHTIVKANNVKIFLNDILLVDYIEPEQADGREQRPGRRLSSGTFALQGHDPESVVHFKNILVKPLPENILPLPAPEPDNIDNSIIQLGMANFPMIDFHVHLKGGLTLEDALKNSRKVGIQYGIAPNCGKGFPIQDDQGITDFLQTMEGAPVYLGMQAEGREWVTMFSEQAVAKFDYVFTDAMTFTENNGNRIRLWIEDEVNITDEQAFMDMYVDKIVKILNDEPIDIYVNATFLPKVIADKYDQLWTKERMLRVVDAAVLNDVAIEINSRYRIPSIEFLKLAKKTGAKFSMGTNNGDSGLGRLEYCLEAVEACELTWKDMFMPRPDGMKKVQLYGFKK